MSFGDAKRIIGEAASMGVEKLAISGGEAILWDGLVELIETAATSGMAISLYTSGVGRMIENVSNSLTGMPGARMILSLYSHKPEVHDSITQCQGSHGTTLKSIRFAVGLGIQTGLHFAAMRGNYRNLADVARLARSLGVTRISVLRLVPQGRSRPGGPDLILQQDDNLRLRKLVTSAREILDIRVGSPYGFLHVSNSPRCSAGVDRLIVLPDLAISPCDAFKQVKPEQIAGTDAYSRLDRCSLSESWERSPYLIAVRKHLQEPQVAPCSGCASLPLCLSGCTAQRFITHGRLVRGPDPMCLQRGAL